MKKLLMIAFVAVMLSTGANAVYASTTNWSEGIAYNPGKIVMYDGVKYKCIRKHTSNDGLLPFDSPNTWKREYASNALGSPSYVDANGNRIYGSESNYATMMRRR